MKHEVCMKWAAPIEHFYALTTVIFNPDEYDTKSALAYFGIKMGEEPSKTATPIKRAKTKRPPKEKLIEMYKTMDQHEIAVYYGVSQSMVSVWFKQYRENKPESISKKIKINDELYDSLKSQRLKGYEIAKAFNVSPSKISFYKHERGIK